MSALQVDMNLLLASSVHDIKNSLGIVLAELDRLIEDSSTENESERQRLAVLRGESARINSGLVSLLGLYRLQQNNLPVRIEEVFIDDWLAEQCADLASLMQVRGLMLECRWPTELTGFFDPALVAGILHNALVNAIRYARSRVIVSATPYHDSGVCLQVSDDGPGFPEAILRATKNGEADTINFNSGSTRLGLLFARAIAAGHSKGNETGRVALHNHSDGGCFSLYLP